MRGLSWAGPSDGEPLHINVLVLHQKQGSSTELLLKSYPGA